MSQPWHSLFLRTTRAEPVIDALREALAARGYMPYDPFPGGTGTPPKLAANVRQFVAPPLAGWVRVLGAPDDDVLPDFQARIARPVLVGWLTETDGGFALLHDGARLTDPDAFAEFLRPAAGPDMLRKAFAGDLTVAPVEPDEPPVAVLGADGLPPELEQFAQQQGVDAQKANKLAERLGGKLLGRFTGGADDAETREAQALLAGAGGDLWNSLHGQRVRAIAGVLNLPENWRAPTWQQVRDAYQVFRLRERSPRMMLMPGDREAMDAVPDALDYTPVYMGLPQQ